MTYKCEDIGFEHLWAPFFDVARTCRNCDKQEQQVLVQEEVKEWQPVED